MSNDDTSFDPNNPFAGIPYGTVLTPAAGVITPTATHHHVAAGTISSIATTYVNTASHALLLLTADGATTFTAGVSLIVTTLALAANDQILLELDASGVWREIAPQRPSWTGFTPVLSSASGSFTVGSVVTARYRKNGHATRVDLLLTGCTITGTPTWVAITIPLGLTANNIQYFTSNGRDNGTYKFLSVFVDSGTTIKFTVLAEGTGSWSASAGNADIACSIEFETTT